MRRLILCFAVVCIVGACAPLEKRVDLTYQRLGGAGGGSGDVFIARPVARQELPALPSGKRLVGKAEDSDLVLSENPENWVFSALTQELSAAGYNVRTVEALPSGVGKGLKTIITGLSADQSSKVFTIVTLSEVKLEVQLWKDGSLIKTLTASARDQEEGFDRSSEPVRLALEKTLQRVMHEIVPDIIKGLEQ